MGDGNGCYASVGPISWAWKKFCKLDWKQFCAAIAALPIGQLWRHNQAGDLQGVGDRINGTKLRQLVKANRGRRGFTYTHKPPVLGHNAALIKEANQAGFTINLSADNLFEADQLADLGIAPVVVVVPSHQLSNTTTPAGRKVVICPAKLPGRNATCSTCALCQKANRSCIVGFPAHGMFRKKIDARLS